MLRQFGFIDWRDILVVLVGAVLFLALLAMVTNP
jgi:hypothetical protein